MKPSHEDEILAWRRRRLDRLTAPDGWLSLAAIHWLDPGENRLEKLPGVVLLDGDRVILRGPSGDASARPSRGEEVPLVSMGRLSVTALESGGRYAVRLRDPENPPRRAFRGIDYFPIDPAWRLDARFEPYDPPKRIPFGNAAGGAGDEVSPGAVAFEVDGVAFRLEPIFERGETDYWVIFGDATNGRETYGGGRFVYVAPPSNGRTILDFNKAYNPPCVFSPFTTCPLPTEANRLKIRVTAGEMTYTKRA